MKLTVLTFITNLNLISNRRPQKSQKLILEFKGDNIRARGMNGNTLIIDEQCQNLTPLWFSFIQRFLLKHRMNIGSI